MGVVLLLLSLTGAINLVAQLVSVRVIKGIQLTLGLLGGLPVCHGAGGLTAHYRFGSRTPLASLVIGGTCLTLALVFGRALVPLLSAVPYAILGALLPYVGWRHLGLVPKVHQRRDYLTVFAVACVSLLTNNLAVGSVLGIAVDWLFARLRESVPIPPWPILERFESSKQPR